MQTVTRNRPLETQNISQLFLIVLLPIVAFHFLETWQISDSQLFLMPFVEIAFVINFHMHKYSAKLFFLLVGTRDLGLDFPDCILKIASDNRLEWNKIWILYRFADDIISIIHSEHMC